MLDSSGSGTTVLGQLDYKGVAASIDDFDGPAARPLDLENGVKLLGATSFSGNSLPGDRRALAIDWVGGTAGANVRLDWKSGNSAVGEEYVRLEGAGPGELRHGQFWLQVPPEVSGDVKLSFAAAAEMPLGQLTVIPRKTSFDKPPGLTDASADFGDGVVLAGYQVKTSACGSDGCPVDIRLAWRASRTPIGYYKTFVHLVDRNGKIAAQRDQLPGGGDFPTAGWVIGQWIDDPQGTVMVPPGTYEVVVGLYDPDSGRRLADSSGQDQREIATFTAG
jgi:hypothetical protein